MQDPISCFNPITEPKLNYDPSILAATRSGQTMVSLVYRTKIAGHSRSITVTWCRDVLVHGFSISFDNPDNNNLNSNEPIDSTVNGFKLELRPWCFWRKNGSKRLELDGKSIGLFWDLRTAKFRGEPEPKSNYFVALTFDGEVVLCLGDLVKEALRKTGCRPSGIDAVLSHRKEHLFGRRRFATRARFHERGRAHEVSIECNNGCTNNTGSSSIGGNLDSEMVIKVDGNVVINVKHLQWKFRGNETINVSKGRVEVFWDVHDWLFSPGLRHALFIFKPLLHFSSASVSSTSSSMMTTGSVGSFDGVGSSSSSPEFSLFLYAWKLE